MQNILMVFALPLFKEVYEGGPHGHAPPENHILGDLTKFLDVDVSASE